MRSDQETVPILPNSDRIKFAMKHTNTVVSP